MGGRRRCGGGGGGGGEAGAKERREQYIRNGNGKRELKPRVDAIQSAPFYTTVDWAE